MPASLNPGVPEIVAVRGETPGGAEKVRSAGLPVWVIVRTSAPSASVAVAETLIGVPSGPDAVAGAMIPGVELTPAGPAMSR